MTKRKKLPTTDDLLADCSCTVEGTPVYVALPDGTWVRMRAAKIRKDPYKDPSPKPFKSEYVLVIYPELRV